MWYNHGNKGARQYSLFPVLPVLTVTVEAVAVFFCTYDTPAAETARLKQKFDFRSPTPRFGMEQSNLFEFGDRL